MRARERGAKLIFLDAPTLFESGADKLCEKIVVVTADPEIRLRRIIDRDHISAELAVRRMSSQHTDEFFADRADYLIKNNNDTVELRLAVLELLNDLGL